jgi:YD repeat-containing protein
MRAGMQRFVSDGSGGWIHENLHDNSAYTLTGSWSTGFTRTAKDGTVDEFNTSGQLTSTTDPADNETAYNYSSGKLTSIVQPGNQTTSYACDQQTGYLSSITKPDGITSTTCTPHRAAAQTRPRGS